MQAANYKMKQCLFVPNAFVTASKMLLLNERALSPEERTRRACCCTPRAAPAKDTLNHNYESGKCIYCGEPEIAYAVTIPATVELGNAANATATISAENVTLPTDKTLKVTVNGPFTATLVGTTDVTAHYTIKNHQPSRPVTAGALPLQKRRGGFHIRPCPLAAR